MNVARIANDKGFRTKVITLRSGKATGGNKFDMKNIRKLLTNPIYIGKITHKENTYEGMHQPIIDSITWTKVQNIFKMTNRIRSIGTRVSFAPLLIEILRCGSCDRKMTPTYTSKQGKKYRYYICAKKHKGADDNCLIGRISASEIEDIVTDTILGVISSPEIVVRTIEAGQDILTETQIIEVFKSVKLIWDELFPLEKARIIRLLIKMIIVTEEGVDVRIFKSGLSNLATQIQGDE